MRYLKSILKKILSKNIFLPFMKGHRFIFIYHDVSEVDSAHFSIHYSTTNDSFKRHLQFFKKHFELITLDQIVSKNLDKRKNYASIVFDDGFKSILDNAKPVLDINHIPYAIFVNKNAILNDRLWLSDFEMGNEEFLEKLKKELDILKEPTIEELKRNNQFNDTINLLLGATEKINSERTYLNQEEIKMLSDLGVIIGNHTVNHPVLASCKSEIQKIEIAENKAFIDSMLQKESVHFAFPFGKKDHFDESTLSLLRTEKYQYFYTSNPVSFSEKDLDSGLIPRIGILNDTNQQLMFYINRQFVKRLKL